MAEKIKPKYGKYMTSIIVLASVLIGWGFMFIFSVIPLLLFLFPELIVAGVLAFVIYKLVKYHKKQKVAVLEKVDANQKSEEDLIRLYGLAGIPILRDENGKIRDIYDLLGITPQYDENGNRILTVYELLGLVPRFTNNGQEIPTFLSIKNKIKKFIKTEKATGILTRKLSEKEKEEYQLRRILEEKKKEAEIFGNKSKAQAIQKTLDGAKASKAGKKQGKKASGGDKIKLEKAPKPVKFGTIKPPKAGKQNNFFNDVFSLLSTSDEKVSRPLSNKNSSGKSGPERGFDAKGTTVETETSSTPAESPAPTRDAEGPAQTREDANIRTRFGLIMQENPREDFYAYKGESTTIVTPTQDSGKLPGETPTRESVVDTSQKGQPKVSGLAKSGTATSVISESTR